MMKMVLILAFVCSTIFAQVRGVVGELYSVEEGITNFGKAVKSIPIKTAMLREALEKTDDYILFKIDQNSVRFLNSKRVGILGRAANRDEVFNVMSKKKILELIEKGGSETTYFNKTTSGHDTITNGERMLQKSEPCPPFC